jgi:hypothetical protein
MCFTGRQLSFSAAKATDAEAETIPEEMRQKRTVVLKVESGVEILSVWCAIVFPSEGISLS